MKVLIVDDEALARERLTSLLAEIPGVTIVGEAADGVSALAMVDSTGADVVLLDIVMPAMDGLEVARHLAAHEPAPAVIFCTAFDDHALEAFEASALDYLVKPVRAERLRASLARAQRFSGEASEQLQRALPLARRRSHICARFRGSLKLVSIADIAAFVAEDKYVVVHHDHGELLIEESLKALEDEFGDQFVRIHRNCLAAVERIEALTRAPDGRMLLRLRGMKEPVEVSRRNLAALRRMVRTL